MADDGVRVMAETGELLVAEIVGWLDSVCDLRPRGCTCCDASKLERGWKPVYTLNCDETRGPGRLVGAPAVREKS